MVSGHAEYRYSSAVVQTRRWLSIIPIKLGILSDPSADLTHRVDGSTRSVSLKPYPTIEAKLKTENGKEEGIGKVGGS